MFCSTELAARIERTECRMLADAVATLRTRLPDLFAVEVGGGFAVLSEPGSPLNKVAGLGFAPLDEAAWAAVEREHARRGAPIQVELATLGDPAVARSLTGRSFRLVGVENVLGRALTAADADADGRGKARSARAEIAIDVCSRDDLELWIELAVEGFLHADAQGVPSHESFERSLLQRVLRDVTAAAGVTLFVARLDGTPAGAASLRIDGGIAQLSGASTLPACRRRGVQWTFLAHRLAHAARAGCDLAVVTTTPGSKSQQNLQRSGFDLLYARNVLVREPA